jgi:uncharacterized Zn-binding protein involved in type VI secretion
MRQPAAKEGDGVKGLDLHLVTMANGATATVPMPFDGVIQRGLSTNVNIMGKPAATIDSIAKNPPEHAHKPAPGVRFVFAPNNEGRITTGSGTVRINGKPAARNGDRAETCHDQPGVLSLVVASGSVLIG